MPQVNAAPARAEPGRGTRPFHTLNVAAVESLCDDAAAITFEVPAELRGAFTFAAGQSVTVRRIIDGREERRNYSICAPVGAPPRIGVRKIPDGLFSSWLVDEVTAGTRIDVQEPTGNFRADPSSGGRHLCIAAGSGITPMLSVAASLLTNPAARVTMFYGNRTSRTVMFADDLADLKDTFGPRFELVHVLSREPRDVELFAGRLDGQRLARLLDALVPVRSLDHVWLCGPLAMLQEARTVLMEAGVRPESIHRELFYVDEPPPEFRHADAIVDGETSDVTIRAGGRASTAPVLKSTPILDGAQKIRTDLPFACKGGVCGTCRAKVRSGETEMRRNYALEDSEVQDGFILTCQSHAISPSVEIDYDA